MSLPANHPDRGLDIYGRLLPPPVRVVDRFRTAANHAHENARLWCQQVRESTLTFLFCVYDGLTSMQLGRFHAENPALRQYKDE